MYIISMLTIQTVAIVVSISYSTKSMTFFYWILYFQILARTLVLVTIVHVISVKIIWSFWNEMNLCRNLFAIYLYFKIYFQRVECYIWNPINQFDPATFVCLSYMYDVIMKLAWNYVCHPWLMKYTTDDVSKHSKNKVKY